ncbi:Na+/H+ antiporter subunit E [Nesterenkonia sp. CL21]|uniref:Na+/H+ antiporter subunit E n=1 Tax=Nesterenkonia sp. CL21 TaxID=3064894 RepID=UPI00287B2B69|nr:Na+/H+ antiporter subunit E [Nesterenkonia sp. CL21]MDS2171231.1 Na+/H+ antiporter subunit E [Nesterenkonia sp. CL21]
MSIQRLSRQPWPLRILSFLLWYAKEFLLANLKVTADVLRPRRRMRMTPAIVAVPAASRTDTEWTLISALITLTPGTLTITLSKEHGILYVHGMFVDTRESLVTEIQEMEDRLLHATRRDVGDLTRPLEAPVVAPVDVDEDEAGDPL